MSNLFRQLLQKVGSGSHTTENLAREEAATATKMMLLAEAKPAQIGAFLIAHRIKRPTGEELAGMLDAYEELGPKLQPRDSEQPVIVLGVPYDGRVRTSPITPIIALLLTTVGKTVIMHGGDRLPTKYGLPLIEVWQGLGVDWSGYSLPQIQQIFEQTDIGFIYTPKHFPLTQTLWEYRDQLGKRPPLATMELIWSPYGGNAHVMAGFVHPPTEAMFHTALGLRGIKQFTFIKGLEGSCDLPRDRTAIIGLSSPTTPQQLERLHLAPRDYGITSKNVPLVSPQQVIQDLKAVVAGEAGEMMQTALWNGGFYLWRSGVCADMISGMTTATELFKSGAVAQKLQQLISCLANHSSA
ncbi:glycosyl transferase, family 3 [Richelia sinica FACHB-800]|uniref:Glycosyl transferase, family 3 n=1 Tax=Richelia sinica FACHB-800 TaxID=1357546 RepID=A0A975TAX8_9NOST|nr:anthranilate phosphoribosyltransferase family protein [Richelia sinica]MBD2663418.1 anthranilate phosphoribosyltransferase family protein [Richelia sinica FACHB-800]QXE24596.1 glycosyl transferase, family 3 [Richelia sinica FACHB-800]